MLCLAVRLSTLGSLALRADEVLTAQAIGLDWTDLAVERLVATHSPLYFWMLKGLGLQGASEFFLRLPSAILNSLACTIFVAVAWRLSGRIGAIVMMLLYCFGPLEIAHAQDARPYALLMFFVAVATLGYVSAISPGQTGDPSHTTGEREDIRLSRLAFVVATVGTIGAGLTMIGGWIVVVALQASIIVLPRALQRRVIRLWLLHVAVTWLGIAPFAIAVFPYLHQAAGGYWAEQKMPLSIDSLALIADQLYLRPGQQFEGIWSTVQIIGNLVSPLIALVALIELRNRPSIRLVSFVSIAIPVFLVGVSAVQSVLIIRYFLPALPFLGLMTSAGASLVWGWRLGWIAICVFSGAVVLQGIYAIFVPEEDQDFRAVAQFLSANGSQNIVMITKSDHRLFEINHYLTSGKTLSVIERSAGKLTVDDIHLEIEKNQTLWLLYKEENMAVVADHIPGDVLRCDWHDRGQTEWRLVLLARDRRDLPIGLRLCEPDNGDL